MEIAATPLLPNGSLNVPDAQAKALRLAKQQGLEVTGANVNLEGGQVFMKQGSAASSGKPRKMSDIETAQFKAEMDGARSESAREAVVDKWKLATGESVYIYDRNGREFIVDWDKANDYIQEGYLRTPPGR